MSASESILAVIGTLGSAVIATFGGYWVATRGKKQPQWKKEMIAGHPLFDRINQLKLVEVRSMTCGDAKKDAAIKKYANLLLDVHRDELRKVAQAVNADAQTSIADMYMDVVNHLNTEIDRLGLPAEFLDKLQADSLYIRASVANEIISIQNSGEMQYIEKVYRAFDSIRVHLALQIAGLPRVL